MRGSILVVLGLSMVAPLARVAADAESPATDMIVREDFSGYDGDEALREVWRRADDTAPNRSYLSLADEFAASASIGGVQKPEHAPLASLGNGVAVRDIGRDVGDDLRLSCRVLISRYSRSAIIALLNEAGTQGYGVWWNANLVNQYGGQGSVRVVKFDLGEAWTNWDTTGEPLGKAGISGHYVTGYPVTALSETAENDFTKATYGEAWQGFARIDLEWKKATGTLTVSVDGKEVTQAIDTDFSGFRRIYIRGNSEAYFDDIELSVQTAK